jgi:hypothetical protein
MVPASWKIVLGFSKKLKIEQSYDPKIPFWVPQKIERRICKRY